MKYLLPFIIICSVMLISNCKRGPEDPVISFRSREIRLEGEWYADYYVVNGFDSLPSRTSTFDTTINGIDGTVTCDRTNTFNLTLNHNNSYTTGFHFDQTIHFKTDSVEADTTFIISNTIYTKGNWSFDGDKDGFKKKELLKLSGDLDEETFEIVELRSKKIQLKYCRLYPVTTNDTINYLVMEKFN